MGKIIIIIQIRFFNIVFSVPENVSRQRPETYKPLAKISRPLIKKYKPLVNVSRPANILAFFLASVSLRRRAPWCHLWCYYRCYLALKSSR